MIFATLKSAIKPFRLVSMVMTYLLGAGLVQYVRNLQDWSAFFEGILFLVCIAIGFELLILLKDLTERKNWPEGSNFRDVRQIRWAIAGVGATLFTTAMAILVNWMVGGTIRQGLAALISGLVFVSALYYFASSSEAMRPYSVLIELFLFLVIPPGLAYFLQSSDLHRLLSLVLISLAPAYLAYRLLMMVMHYAQDENCEIRTLVTQMGWQKAMTFHNVLILLSFVFLGMASIFGFPWFLLWPVFLALPIGLLEIWLMERVRRGSKPLWGIMQFTAAMVYFIPIYLIGLAFWIR